MKAITDLPIGFNPETNPLSELMFHEILANDMFKESKFHEDGDRIIFTFVESEYPVMIKLLDQMRNKEIFKVDAEIWLSMIKEVVGIPVYN